VVIKTLKKEKKVKLQGLGILAVKNRKARMGRNPATGAEIKIPAKRVVKFRVAKDLKDKVL
jgi:DNA-binding protein HU-beta